MNFDLTDLRLFVLVADEVSLTRGAKRQHLSLPAASARIKSLEIQSGQALFVRESRGVRLTGPGEAFLHHALGILRSVDRLETDLKEYGGGLRGRVRVFANHAAASDLPEILPTLLSSNPGMNVDLQEILNAEIAPGVLEGRADLGIVFGQVDTLGLRASHFSTDRLVLAVAKNHPFARHKRAAFADILDQDIVGMPASSALQTFLVQAAEKLGAPLRLRIQLPSFDAICRLIGAGVGVGIVPESIGRRNQSTMGLELIELLEPWSVRERYILTREEEELSIYARTLIETLHAFYAPPKA